MPRGNVTFKQADLARAIKAATSAGVKARIEVSKDGKIVIFIDEAESLFDIECRRNEWDAPP